MQADHFNDKEGLIEYNVNCFKETLAEVFRPLPRRRKVSTLTASSGIGVGNTSQRCWSQISREPFAMSLFLRRLLIRPFLPVPPWLGLPSLGKTAFTVSVRALLLSRTVPFFFVSFPFQGGRSSASGVSGAAAGRA